MCSFHTFTRSNRKKIVSQLRVIPYIKKNLDNSNSEGKALNWIELFELAE